MDVLQNGVYICRTLWLVLGAPKELQEAGKGRMVANSIQVKRKRKVIVLLWQEKRVVPMISTFCNVDTMPVIHQTRGRWGMLPAYEGGQQAIDGAGL